MQYWLETVSKVEENSSANFDPAMETRIQSGVTLWKNKESQETMCQQDSNLGVCLNPLSTESNSEKRKTQRVIHVYIYI